MMRTRSLPASPKSWPTAQRSSFRTPRTLEPVLAMHSAISVSHLWKTYASGFCALKDINLDIHHREIFALLGPNGAGKTTLISIICGIVNPTSGTVSVDGHDIITSYRR